MRKILGLLLAVVAICGSALAADEYKIDPNHSSVNFAVTHLMVSTVNGRFNAFEGKILFDDKDVTKSSVNVTIKIGQRQHGQYLPRQRSALGRISLMPRNSPRSPSRASRSKRRAMIMWPMAPSLFKGVAKDVDLPFEMKGPADAGKMEK